MRVRRIACREGCGAWWYVEVSPRGGRPVERCPRCWERHDVERRRENARNTKWKAKQIRFAGVAA